MCRRRFATSAKRPLAFVICIFPRSFCTPKLVAIISPILGLVYKILRVLSVLLALLVAHCCFLMPDWPDFQVLHWADIVLPPLSRAMKNGGGEIQRKLLPCLAALAVPDCDLHTRGLTQKLSAALATAVVFLPGCLQLLLVYRRYLTVHYD